MTCQCMKLFYLDTWHRGIILQMILLHKIGARNEINLMPLLKIHSLGKEQAWAVWHITETEQALSGNALEDCPQNLINSHKRMEWMAARLLTQAIIENIGRKYHGLGKDEFGKPFLKNHP